MGAGPESGKKFLPQIPGLYWEQANGCWLLIFEGHKRRPKRNHFEALWIFTEYNTEAFQMLAIRQQNRKSQCQDWNKSLQNSTTTPNNWQPGYKAEQNIPCFKNLAARLKRKKHVQSISGTQHQAMPNIKDRSRLKTLNQVRNWDWPQLQPSTDSVHFKLEKQSCSLFWV